MKEKIFDLIDKATDVMGKNDKEVLDLTNRKPGALVEEITAETGVDITKCYQCGKCSAGCIMGDSMDILPRQAMRSLQLGLEDEVLHSKAPWICATCHVCSARCPHDIPVSEVMEALRHAADRRKIRPVRTAHVFTKYFLLPIRLFGRSHELIMSAFYNVFSGRFFQNLRYLPKMFFTGKFGIIVPTFTRDVKQMRAMMKRCDAEDRND